jgi:hypothetical protein
MHRPAARTAVALALAGTSVLGLALSGCASTPRSTASAAPVSVVAVAAPPPRAAGVTATAAPGRPSTTPGTPGTVARPVGRVHLEVFEWFNVLQVVDTSEHIVRTIRISGNPEVPKPDECTTQGRIRLNWDYTYQWQLNYFTRLCAGRGIGTHAIPVDGRTGAESMDATDLGRPPGHGAPLSHGCLRMSTADAEYVYDNFADGVPVYFVRTPWAG